MMDAMMHHHISEYDDETSLLLMRLLYSYSYEYEITSTVLPGGETVPSSLHAHIRTV